MHRSQALDSLRGLAILLMVLSGSIAFGDVLPGWMYHAQVPPPLHVFKPEIPGITWVDLVFPFFLFSMGAAFPLALQKKLEVQPDWKTVLQIIQRFVLLVFFALFTFHARPWVMKADAGAVEYLLATGCFLLLFLMYAQTFFEPKRVATLRRITGFVLAVLFLAFYPFKEGGFSLTRSDIIIIVLANMALFGSVIWIFTKNKPWYRLGILPFVMAVFLSGKESGSWTGALFNWSPLPWAYTFYYLKYLFIIIPGTFAGEWLREMSTVREDRILSKKPLFIAALCLVLIGSNITFLYSRNLVLNLFLTLSVSALLIYLIKRPEAAGITDLSKFLYAGIYLLILGLFFEAYEGGIKKDFSTYSYYFVSSGLAFLTLLVLIVLERLNLFGGVLRFLGDNGKNPMIAYTAGNLFLIPVLKLTGAENILNVLNSSAAGGFCRGLIFTAIVALITIYFTRKRIFWRT